MFISYFLQVGLPKLSPSLYYLKAIYKSKRINIFIKISGLIFNLKLEVLQLVDVPGNILYFVNISGRLFSRKFVILNNAKVTLRKKFTAELITLFLFESIEF